MSIERLRALENDLREEERQQLAESRRHAAEGNDETVQAFCNGKAFGLNAAAQRIATLIAELGQEVGAVADERLCDFFADVGEVEQFMDDLCNVVTELTGDEGEDDPITVLRRYIATSPAHTSEARDAARYRALKTHFQAKFHRATCDYWVIVGELKTDPRFIGEDGEQLTLDNALDAAIAAMRQEGGNG